MSAEPNPQIPLAQMALLLETDVVLCRNRARLLAETLGFDRQQQVRIATAVSEIARNAFRYAKGAQATFALLTTTDYAQKRQGLLTTITDRGPGIAEIDAVLNGTYRSKTGMGAGIRGVKRLLDRVEIETSPAGTTVKLLQNLPKGAMVKREALDKVANEMKRTAPASPIEELAAQNQDLFETLDQITVQRSELEQINEELSETNRGVVALYDELDTVHRVGRVVASKLNLESLLSAITDATTEISGAEFGAYFHVAPGEDRLVCQTSSGVLSAGLKNLPAPKLKDLLPTEDAEVVRFDDKADGGGVLPLGAELPMRSLLTCAVRDDSTALVGVLVFGHTQPAAFTERTERILSTVAVQVSIGIANAKLYRSAQTANDAKDRFLAILSHELRTPLNPVFAILTSLEEHAHIPQDVREDLVMMRRNLELETRLIDDLLDLTRIAQGKMPLTFEPHNLHDIIADVCRTCQGEIEKKRTQVVQRLEAKASFVSGDAGRLQQVLWNLLNNAVKFTPPEGTITLQTTNSTPGRIIFTIADTGRGIEPGALDRVFNPFEQGGSDVASRFGGLGLGLAISKSIIDAHGGEIRVESEGVNQGTTFQVTLPTVVVTKSAADTPAKPEPEKPSSLRILLVDDHDDTRMIMGRMLVARGHQVTEADSVTEALAKYKKGTFDLLISDLGLPDGSGHELMVAIQKTRPIRGIVLSGYGMETDVAKSRAAGFEEHLTKPVDFAQLDAAIARVVDSLL